MMVSFWPVFFMRRSLVAPPAADIIFSRSSALSLFAGAVLAALALRRFDSACILAIRSLSAASASCLAFSSSALFASSSSFSVAAITRRLAGVDFIGFSKSDSTSSSSPLTLAEWTTLGFSTSLKLSGDAPFLIARIRWHACICTWLAMMLSNSS